MGSMLWNHKERSGALPYHLVEANEKVAFGPPRLLSAGFGFDIFSFFQPPSTCHDYYFRNIYMTFIWRVFPLPAALLISDVRCSYVDNF